MKITVCAACGAQACWDGALMCEDAAVADVTEVEVDPCPSTLRDARPHPLAEEAS